VNQGSISDECEERRYEPQDKASPGLKFYQKGDVTIKIEEGVDVEDVDMETLDMTAAATRTPYMLTALQAEDTNPTPLGGGLQGAMFDQRRVKIEHHYHQAPAPAPVADPGLAPALGAIWQQSMLAQGAMQRELDTVKAAAQQEVQHQLRTGAMEIEGQALTRQLAATQAEEAKWKALAAKMEEQLVQQAQQLAQLLQADAQRAADHQRMVDDMMASFKREYQEANLARDRERQAAELAVERERADWRLEMEQMVMELAALGQDNVALRQRVNEGIALAPTGAAPADIPLPEDDQATNDLPENDPTGGDPPTGDPPAADPPAGDPPRDNPEPPEPEDDPMGRDDEPADSPLPPGPDGAGGDPPPGGPGPSLGALRHVVPDLQDLHPHVQRLGTTSAATRRPKRPCTGVGQSKRVVRSYVRTQVRHAAMRQLWSIHPLQGCPPRGR